MNRIRFERHTSTAREAEPVYVSIPLAKGTVRDQGRLRILDGDRPLPVQARVLSTWPDGTIRWLLAVFQPDLPSDQGKEFAYDLEGATPVAASCPIHIEPTPAGWRVDTGPLQAVIRRDRFDLLHEVCLNGRQVLAPGSVDGGFFYEQAGGLRQDLASGTVESAAWVEAGPLRARLTLKGTHGGSNAPV